MPRTEVEILHEALKIAFPSEAEEPIFDDLVDRGLLAHDDDCYWWITHEGIKYLDSIQELPHSYKWLID